MREEVETNVFFFSVFPLSLPSSKKQTLNAALKKEPSRPSDATPAAAPLPLPPPPPLCGEGGGRAAEEEENQRLLCCDCDCCDADDDAEGGALASRLPFPPAFFVSSSGAAAAASVGVTGLRPEARSPTPSAPSSSSSLLASMETLTKKIMNSSFFLSLSHVFPFFFSLSHVPHKHELFPAREQNRLPPHSAPRQREK